MYSATLGALGATPKCLTKNQLLEAARLCNCKRYGLPSSPAIHGLSATAINVSSGANPCDSRPRVAMPSDFNPQDPCEAASRAKCPPRLARPTSTTTTSTAPPPYNDSAQDYEDEIVEGTIMRQRLMVGGVLGAFLLVGGLLVYRARKG